MTLLITPEEAQTALQARPPYATIGDFKELLNSKITKNCSEETLAIDVLEMPLTKMTTFPHWAVAYLHSQKNTHIEESDLMIAASSAGYRISDMRFVKKFLEDTQSNIGVWYNQENKKTYYCWYDPDEFTQKNQECLDRGDDW